MEKESITEKYFQMLKAYVFDPKEKYLVSAAVLGRELVVAEIPPEEISEMHEDALVRLGEEYPKMRLIESARIISTPLMELLMAYGLAFRQRSEELESYRNHLEALVKDRTDQVDAFAYTISHDLRAPLRSMKGFAMALLKDFGDMLSSTGRDYAGRIIDAADWMEILIKDLLSYSRLGRKEMGFKTVDLEMVIKHVIDQLDTSIQEKKALVAVERPLFKVRADPWVLQSVLLNLMTNAIKFVAPETRAEVKVSAEEKNGRVRLWVEDKGIGIAPEHHERIFNAFERLHGMESYPGTGIGLALVKIGIKRMGGKTGVKSICGKGSRFWIELKKEGRGDG